MRPLLHDYLKTNPTAVSDIDNSAAQALRSIYLLLNEKGIRLVVAQVLDDVKVESRGYGLRRLFGEDAFYDTLVDVVTACQHHLAKGVK